jgi:hypothetical protein
MINNEVSEHQPIEHIVIKRQFQSEQKMRFEIDNCDCHLVPFQRAIDETKHFVWKTNLLGGGLLFHLIYRLSLLRTLKEFLKNKSKQNKEWLHRSGYKIGGKTEKTKFDYVNQGDKIIDIDEDGNLTIDIEGEKTDMFESSPPAMMYKPPFIIFDQVLGNERIPTALVENYKKEYLYFNRDFVGISAPKNELKVLKNIYGLFTKDCSKLYQLYILTSSASAMILLETAIRKNDMEVLPFPKNQDYLKLSKTEEFIQNDVLDYYRHLAKSPDGDAKVLFEPITRKDAQLKQFGETYCDAMNEIYETDTQTWQIGTVTQTPNFTIYRIGFGEKESLKYQYEKEKTDDVFAFISNDLQNAGVRFTRVVRYYKHENGFDFVCFIKPNARRYWLNSIALRDAGNTYMDFKKAGF